MLQVFAAVLAGALLSYYLIFRRKSGPPLPPGPKPLPIVGNVLDLPPKGVPEYQHWLTFKDKYGPLSSITILGQTLIIIQDSKIAHDLLEKNSQKTSGRPYLLFASKLCGFEMLLPGKQYNTVFRLHRKLIHQQIGTRAVTERFRDIEDVESKRILLRTLAAPNDVFEHIKTEASAIILKLTYGYTIEKDIEDPLVSLIEHMMDNFTKAFIPMKWSVDIFPFLRYLPEAFPGMSWKATARKWHAINRMVINTPYEFVVNQMAKGTNQPSFVSAHVAEWREKGDQIAKAEQDHETAIKEAAAAVYAGGADTTVTALIVYVLAMMKFPHVQKKAQAEIDAAIGGYRFPTFEDREKLPYVSALVKELLRWSPVVPVCVTHVTTDEIIYDGYRIPKGSYVLPSIWWFAHDPKTYSDPLTFDPDRYFAPRNEPDPSSDVFGFGRRICPGRYIADESLFMTVARLLTVFNVNKVLDDQGKEIEPEWVTTPGLISRPHDFPYSIVPRSDRHKQMILDIEAEHPWEKSDAELLKGLEIEH